MADLVIRGMEMPKENEILVFDMWHGKVYARSTANNGTKRYEVVFLPEGHGRLIDADAFKAMCLSATKKAKPDFIRHEDWLKSCAVTQTLKDKEHFPVVGEIDMNKAMTDCILKAISGGLKQEVEE